MATMQEGYQIIIQTFAMKIAFATTVIGIIIILSLGFTKLNPDKQLPNNPSDCLKFEGPWASNFKNMVFLNCLGRLYPKDFATIVSKSDMSSSANMEWMNHDVEVIKEVNLVVEGFLEKDEAKYTIEGKKVIMNVCLEFRLSTELDSLTGVAYNKYNSTEPKMSAQP